MIISAIVIFLFTYAGVALGRVPGLTLDRTGIALLGAIAMVVAGIVSIDEAVRSIDFPTIILLYALMVVSAQLRLGGFYTWSALRITVLLEDPRPFLLVLMVVSAVFSAILANDIVCLAFTPVLTWSLLRARLHPLPFLIGLAVSTNIGSAATVIGNPQNMLIGQIGRLDFTQFLFWCAPPSILALVGSYGLICLICRGDFHKIEGAEPGGEWGGNWPNFNRWQSVKGLIAVTCMVALFFSPLPRELSALAVAGFLLCSRKMKTRHILELVDWHLITLFCALFVVIHGIESVHVLERIFSFLGEQGLDMGNLSFLTIVSAVMSNFFSNVPATMLLTRFLDPSNPLEWYTLALSSTFAGNLIVIGSIANLIVIEQAARYGVRITFADHARVGIPVTLFSLCVLILWIYW